MELNYLNDFLVLAETKNFFDAADRLSLSDSTLSRHIKALEDELGFTLFDRTTRSLSISPYGIIFLKYAEQILALKKQCSKELTEAAQQIKHTISITSGYYAGDILANFMHNNRDIIFNVIDCHGEQEDLKNKLKRKECTFAFIIDLEDSDNSFNAAHYVTDSYIAVLPADHPLALRDSISLSELSHDAFVSFKTNSPSDLVIKKMCKEAGFKPKISLSADVGSSIIPLIKQGFGVSILQKKTIYKMNVDFSGVKIIDIEPKPEFTVSIIHLKNAKLTSAEKEFYEFCCNMW